MRRLERALTWWDGRVGLVVLDVAVAAAALAFDLGSGDPRDPHSPLHLPVVFVACLALLVRRRFPLAVLVVTAVCMTVDTTLLPLTVALYSVAARHGVSVRTGVGALVAAGTEVAQLVPRGPVEWTDFLPALGMFVVAPVLAGLWMHQRAALLVVLRDRAEEAEQTRTLLADQAVAAERRRIAREMHDVVAHRVTAIALQAGALSVHTNDARTEEFAETIRGVSVTALDELRGILRVLRDEAEQGEAPATIASIETLVADVVATGAKVELVLPDPLPAIPGDVERAVYRVVQESLTNAAKHAPHAAVEVRVSATAAELAVEVTNRLMPGRAEVPGSGYGLLGMRERVELAGGELRAGRDKGVFGVVARFPLEEETWP